MINKNKEDDVPQVVSLAGTVISIVVSIIITLCLLYTFKSWLAAAFWAFTNTIFVSYGVDSLIRGKTLEKQKQEIGQLRDTLKRIENSALEEMNDNKTGERDVFFAEKIWHFSKNNDKNN